MKAAMARECANTQEYEVNAAAPCKDDSSENGRITGYRTKNIPDRIRVIVVNGI
ncbi:MAG TPA: hypothetical protein VFZ55_05980 [Nitrososphaera sp.]